MLYYSVQGRQWQDMNSIGETLRRERLRQGLDLEDVSQETKVNTRLLEAIESDQWDRLPGGVFTRNFVRQYARALGLDEQDFEPELNELEPDEGPARRPAPLTQHMPLEGFGGRLSSSSSLTSFVLVMLVILACAGIYALWQGGTRPTRASSMAALPASPAVHPKTEASPPAVPEAPAPAPASPESAGEDIQVAINASEPVWISATSSGRSLYAGTLKPGEGKTLAATSKMKIVFGNAGGVAVTFNGKSLGAPGPKGQVRIMELDPQDAHVRTPPSEDTPDTPPSMRPSAAAKERL